MTGRTLPCIQGAIVAVLLHAPAAAWAQAPRVTVQTDRAVVSLGEPFWVTVTVHSQGGGASVSLPPGAPFELLQHGATSRQTQWSLSLGLGRQATTIESLRWRVRATSLGRQQLGPMVVRIGGQQFQAGSTTLQVNPGAGSPQPTVPPNLTPGTPPPETPPAAPTNLPGAIDPADLDGAAYDPELFLRTVVEPREAYVGQQVVMTLFLYTTLNLSNVNVTREPSTNGFWSEDLLGPARRLAYEQDQVVGQSRFRVAVLRRIGLFPLREGTLSIGAPQLEASSFFTSLFSRRGGTVSRSGVEVPVQIRPLPAKGRPDGFQNGNVGRFDIVGRVDHAAVKVGEPVTLTVTVRGDGNLRNIKTSPMPEVDGARVYEPQVRDAVAPRGQAVVSGERRWEYLVLPQQQGALLLPAIELSYFDPNAEQYQTKSSDPITVNVSGKAATPGAPAVGIPGTSSEALPDSDSMGPLRSIRRRAALSTGAPAVHERWWFLLLVLLAPAAFLALAVVDRVRRRRMASQDALRARKAAGKAKKALRAVSRDDNVGLAEVSRALHRFLADRFGEPASGLTRQELQGYLEERGVGEEQAGRVAAFLEECEKRRYAPTGGESGAAAFVQEAMRHLDELDDAARGKGGKP